MDVQLAYFHHPSVLNAQTVIFFTTICVFLDVHLDIIIFQGIARFALINANSVVQMILKTALNVHKDTFLAIIFVTQYVLKEHMLKTV